MERTNMDNDPVRQIYDVFARWCEALPDRDYFFLLRTLALYGLSTILCWLAFLRGSRSVMVQWVCLTVGVLLAFVLPLGAPPRNEHVKTWIVTLAAVALTFLPAVLPLFLVRRYRPQNMLRIVLYTALGVAVLAEVWSRRGL